MVGIKRSYLTEEEVEGVYKLFGEYSKELGFVSKPILKESSKKGRLIIAKEGDEIVGACNYNVRKDKVGVIYEIAVAKGHRGRGIGELIVEEVRRGVFYVELKCPVDNESNGFYEKAGFQKVGLIKKKEKRDLYVWRKKGI